MRGRAVMVYLPYWSEVYILLKLCEVCPASWWWLALFATIDLFGWLSYDIRAKETL